MAKHFLHLLNTVKKLGQSKLNLMILIGVSLFYNLAVHQLRFITKPELINSMQTKQRLFKESF